MKATDNYNAKYQLWAAKSTVIAAGAAVKLPDFKSRRFTSHAELNDWKASVLRQLVATAAK